MAINDKPPMLAVSEHAGRHLMRNVSKAALVDLYLQALAVSLGACDTVPSLQQVADDAGPTLRARGDRVPRWGAK